MPGIYTIPIAYPAAGPRFWERLAGRPQLFAARPPGESVTEYRLELPPRDGARPAAGLVARALGTWKIDDPGGTVRLVVTELIENVHLHTGGTGELRMTLNHGAILIAVSDHSPVQPIVRNPGHRAGGGRGLRIVQALTHSWGSRPHAGGKTVWAQIPLTAPTGNGPGATRRSVRDPDPDGAAPR
ncbi:MAG: hypothetical protein QOJ50_251 [Cryptosporangiaceae bacterium]|nr:hypothetical protein [Cryptosporangiaceae bacterium]